MLARKFYIDIQNRVIGGGNANSLSFFRSDSEVVELYFLKTLPEGFFEFADYSANTIKLAIGNRGNPTSGTFKITDGLSTTAAISYTVTAGSLKSALDAVSGGLFGGGNCAVTGEMPRFIVTVGTNSAGAVSSLSASDNQLAPASNLRFVQRQAASSTQPLIFDLVIDRQPAVLTTGWSALPTTVTASVTTLVSGGAGASEQQKYTFDREPSEGTYCIKFPSRSVSVASVSAGVFTSTAHGLYNNMLVTLTGFTISAGSFANTAYYVTARTDDTFRIAITAGGSAITANATSGGTASLPDIITTPISAQAGPSDVEAAIAAAGFNIGTTASQILVGGVPRQYFTLIYANGSTGRDYPPIQIVASSLLAERGMSGTLDFNTTGVLDLIAAGENTDLTLEIEVAASGGSTQTYTRPASISEDIITVATQPTPPVTTFGTGYMRVETGITGLTGGGATKLDGLVTANGTYPVGICVFLLISGVPQIWQLTSGTTAEDAANGIVRPDDYATSTNQKVWLQRM